MSLVQAALLLLLALPTSRAGCPDYVSASSSTCLLLFENLQAALVGRRLNLYNLRKTFLPTTQSVPNLVNVSYDITLIPLSDNPCPGADENVTEGRYSANTTRFNINFAWTSKVFYTIFHPAMVNRLQPQLAHTLLSGAEITGGSSVATALTWDGVGPIISVQLRLNPVTLPCVPTYSQMVDNLEDLTALLSVYADTQENITSWKNEDLGHVISGLVFAPNWYLFVGVVYPNSSFLPLINLVLAIVLSLILSAAAYYFIWKEIPSSPRERNFLLSQTLLWSGVVVLLQLNWGILYNELIYLEVWCDAGTCADPASVSKLILVSYISLLNITVFFVLLGQYLHGKLRPKELLTPGIQPFVIGIPLVSNAAVLIILVFRIFVKPCKSRYNWVRYGAIHVYETLHYFITCPRKFLTIMYKIFKFVIIFLPFTAIFTFLAIVIFSVIPLMLQLFVYPFRIFAAYSFFFAAFTLFYLVVFVVTFVWKRKGIKNASARLCLLLMLPTVVLLFLAMINIPFISLYRILTSGSLSNNPVVLGAVSLLPSLLLSSPIVWVLKNRIIPKFIEAEENEEEESEEVEEKEEEEEERKGKGSRVGKERSKQNEGNDIEMGVHVENPTFINDRDSGPVDETKL